MTRDTPVARFVRNLLVKRGWKHEELADHLKLERPSVSQWCTGKSMPSDENLIKLAELAGVDASDLLMLKQAVSRSRKGLTVPSSTGDMLSPFEREHLMLIRDEKIQEAINQLVSLLMQKHAA